MRPTFAEINLSNLKYNFINIRKKVKKAGVMAVVKADSYGHGMIECAAALNSLGEKKPEYFGVALLEEAIKLRKSKVSQPILTFSPFSEDEISFYIKYRIEPTVCTAKQISGLSNYKGKKIHVQVNIDTGMGRLGIDYKTACEQIKKLTLNSAIKVTGIYTHFATSDSADKQFAEVQLSRFKSVVETLKSENINYGLAHAANSGAILDMPDSYFDMVRPGMILYGYYPSLETSESVKLKPVMSLISRISTHKNIFAGDSVSYGRLFVADKETGIATVPIGYADGLNRNLTNKMKVIIGSKYYEQVGRITMDRIMLNTGPDKIKAGSHVVLLGRNSKLSIDAWDWCKVLNTIPYEITCNISSRVPRVYK